MQRIAVVRPYPNQYEMWNYGPLTERGFEVTGFVSKSTKVSKAEIGFPTKKLTLLRDLSSVLKYRALLNRYFGDDQVLLGLEKQLNGYHIGHAMEVFNYYTYQVIRAKLAGKVDKVVVTVWENVPLTGDYNLKQSQIKRAVIQNADLFHAISNRTKEALIIDGVPAEKIRTFPYGTDPKRFKPGEKDSTLLNNLGIRPSDVVVLCIGRLVWEKGFDHIIFAAKKLLRDPEVPSGKLKFLLVGEGPRQKVLEYQVQVLSLEERVIMVGSVPYDLIPQIHTIADIFLLPSIPLHNWQEQFGMVLVESMMSGKPVVASLSGSIPEVVGNAGFLVQPGDMLSIAHELKRLILSAKLRHEYGRAARRRAIELFDIKISSNKIEELYLEL